MSTPDVTVEREVCPACGGAGGGPFGRAGSAWDIETYECVRCGGVGYLREGMPEVRASSVPRPGIAKATPAPVVEERKRRTGA